MKKLWFAMGLLVVMAVGGFLHARAVKALGKEMIHLLERAERAVDAGDWAEAETLAAEAARIWKERSGYLHIALRHGDIDRVREGLSEMRGYLRCHEAGSYAAASARLRDMVYTLYEMERLSLTNLL